MKLIAVHELHTNWDGARRFTGMHDADGEPVLQAVVTVIQPGDHFEVPEHKAKEGERLIELGAARKMTPAEVELSQLL